MSKRIMTDAEVIKTHRSGRVAAELHVKKSANLLRDTRCYLIGHMQYANGRGWRDVVKSTFKDSGIKFYDPYHKPFVHDIPEDESSRADMLHWMETEQYDLVAQRMKDVRG